MIELDPKRLFRRLARDIPPRLRKHVLIVGSLAAGYHFRAQLKRRAVNTKDADLVVHPAGDVRSCRQMAEDLMDRGWRRTDDCYPAPEPVAPLQFIRLYPRRSSDYFVELLGLPRKGQPEARVDVPFRLDGGWYAVPCHRFMRITSIGRCRSQEGLEYAAPAMMALANLVSHPVLGAHRMSAPIMGQKILRSAKDLGRVLALAWLSGREAVREWRDPWEHALRSSFPRAWRRLAGGCGVGLAKLLRDGAAFREAHFTTVVGLLNGLGVTLENLKATAEELDADLLRPFAASARRR